MSIEQQKQREVPEVASQSLFARRPLARWVALLSVAGIASPLMTATAFAQQQNAQAGVEEVVVTGTRKLIQDQIAIKRDATTIVDGLSASDIGEMPALSIGEALEAITGAASHRENGGATEITIRGLGPFLSATHFNGREASNGSGDRSVNFSQFPSELMNKVAIAKTQDASMIEGGVAGVIMLDTLKPLEFGKQRAQVDVKANYNPDQQNIDSDLQGDFGYRGTLSYVDQFELGNGHAFGVSLGMQRQDISQPEGEYRSSSPTGTSLWACLNDPTNTTEGFYRSTSGDCEDRIGGPNDQGYNANIDPATGKAYSDGVPYAWTGSSRGYRQNETSDERDSIFVALQYQPSDDWDINFDAQISDRIQSEDRHDLNFEQKRVTPNVTPNALVTTDSGAILEWAGNARFEALGEKYTREENYQAYGFNVAHHMTDRLKVEVDASYSQTEREEIQITNRAQASGTNMRPLVSWSIDDAIPTITVVNTDLNDNTYFNNAYRTYMDRENVRDNEISGLRIDLDYDLGGSFITGIKGGLRGSELTYIQYGGNQAGAGSRTEFSGAAITTSVVNDIIATCSIVFPEKGLLSGVRDGNLITNVDSSGNVIEQGTGNTYAAFNNQCFAEKMAAATNKVFEYPEVQLENSGTTNVTETTYAAYVMADYDSSFMDRTLRGNFGVRVVDTEVDSIGYRNRYEVITNPDTGVLSLGVLDGDLQVIEGGGSYTELLPSVNFVWDYDIDKIIRGGVYRGMSRVNPSDMSYSRAFTTDEDNAEPTTLTELLAASGSGNPNGKPLMSWNADLSFEWYPNDDAIFAAGIYYKRFQGGFEQRTVIEDFAVDGIDGIEGFEGDSVSLPITNSVTTDQGSDLYGLEASVAYRFDSGIGVKFGYNWADTNFEFEDSLYGDTYIIGLDGTRTQLKAGIVDPASVPGFSEHVFNGQVYYQIGDFDTAIIYKYRSSYFQPYTNNPTRIRYVGSVGTWEARAAYKVTDNIRIKVEAINLFSAPKEQYFFTDDNLGEVNDYGPRIFAGVTFKY